MSVVDPAGLRLDRVRVPGRGPGLPTWGPVPMVDQVSRAADPARPGIAVVTMPAELDYVAEETVRRELCDSFAPGVTVLVVDLSGTEFCDSSGWRTLGLARRLGDALDVEVRLVVPPELVVRIFRLTRLHTVFSLYPTLEEALGAGHAPALGSDG